MHETTAVVLLVVVLGQIFIFSIAGIAMWLAGEFGEPPLWLRWGNLESGREVSGLRARQAGAAAASDKHDGLMTLHHDFPIAPKDPDDRRPATAVGRRILDAGFRMTGGARR
jgi:hypothetical protein